MICKSLINYFLCWFYLCEIKFLSLNLYINKILLIEVIINLKLLSFQFNITLTHIQNEKNNTSAPSNDILLRVMYWNRLQRHAKMHSAHNHQRRPHHHPQSDGRAKRKQYNRNTQPSNHHLHSVIQHAKTPCRTQMYEGFKVVDNGRDATQEKLAEIHWSYVCPLRWLLEHYKWLRVPLLRNNERESIYNNNNNN